MTRESSFFLTRVKKKKCNNPELKSNRRNIGPRETYWIIGHFTVVCFVTWPTNPSEAGGDLTWNASCWQLGLRNKSSKVFIKTMPPAASLPLEGQVTEQTIVKWSIAVWLRSDAGAANSLVAFFALWWTMQRIEEFPSNENALLYTVYWQI